MTDKPVVSNFSIDPTEAEESRLSPPRLAMHIAWQSKNNGIDSIVRWIATSLTQ